METSVLNTLLICIFYGPVLALSLTLSQPGVNLPPKLPANFSDDASHWVHSTPLLHDVATVKRPNGPQVIGSRGTTNGGYWNGWRGIKYIYSFGDSYTSTGFDASGPQPNTNNPLGNPQYPGATSSNGPNYIDFLTTTYNKSYIRTYNLGYGGAMIDNAIVESPFGPTVKSFADQMRQTFQPKYTGTNLFPWAMDNTLFIIFFGINDSVNTFLRPNNDSLQYAQIKAYENLVNQLYAAGARNFLFLNIPPIDRTPYAALFSQSERDDLARWIGRFLFRLGALVWNLTNRYPDVTAFQFNTNSFFLRVINNASQFPETAGYYDRTQYCNAYESGTPSMTYYDPSCDMAVDQYLWLNTLHPTYPMHNFMASQISQLLSL